MVALKDFAARPGNARGVMSPCSIKPSSTAVGSLVPTLIWILGLDPAVTAAYGHA
jgi:hypothetical protein